MRQLLNGKEALCLTCQGEKAIVNGAGYVICENCSRMMLIDRKTKEIFIPIYSQEVTRRKRRKRKKVIIPGEIRDKVTPQVFNHKRLQGA